MKRILAYEHAEGFAFLIAKADRQDPGDLIAYIRKHQLSLTEREELAWFLTHKLMPRSRQRHPRSKRESTLRRIAERAQEFKADFKKKNQRGNVPRAATVAFIKRSKVSGSPLELSDVEEVLRLLKNPSRVKKVRKL
ncbi:hypothetical protein LRP30_34260 [Bradyrhizobium sp. C-145]|uniref:hypothetical protein n=1 Tax=Bradyrhizobium sp. C-145 TaxID=574727 RepID=UPI00201B8BF7|nr:hypothetical protein [Bradyrhizobium sp. C-145]UQR61819.1 hypothetical protein LRP30_34260 [Bradyrhizobium sp. C-145]